MKYSDGYMTFMLRHDGRPIIFSDSKAKGAEPGPGCSAMSFAARDLQQRFPDLHMVTMTGAQTFILELQAG